MEPLVQPDFSACIRKEFPQQGAPGCEPESYRQPYCRLIYYVWLDDAP